VRSTIEITSGKPCTAATVQKKCSPGLARKQGQTAQADRETKGLSHERE